MDGVQISTDDFVKINVSNSQNDVISFERKFPKNLSIAELKVKLEVITGGNASTMQLELHSGERSLCKLENNEALLGSYPIENGMRLHVVDSFLFDQNVEKFELTPEQYEQRQESLRSFLKTNKLGKYNAEEMKKLEEQKRQQALQEDNVLKQAQIGLRCKVAASKNKPTRLGTIMYKGSLEGKKGNFIGIKLDEPLGNNDGSLDGKRYFECPPKYGSFVSPLTIEIGDFPPEEFNLDDEL